MNESPILLFENNFQNHLCLSNYQGRNLLVWYGENKLNYCDLNNPDNIKTINTADDFCSDYICTYGNQVVYFDNKSNLYIQEIAADSEPGIVPVNAAIAPVCLIKDRIYYLDQDINICFYDLNTLENYCVVKLDRFPVTLASNGSDIVWRNHNNTKSYWCADVSDLRIEGAVDVVEKGDVFQLNAVALYTNKEQEDISEKAKWYSSNSEVISVEGGLCRALSSGTAVITVDYQGKKLSVPVVVKEVIGMEIIPHKSDLQLGDREQFKAFLVYSDGSRVDVTDQALWLSQLNEIENGIYRADKPGDDVIKVYYGGFNSSLTIVVNDYKRPDETKDDSKHQTQPRSSKKHTDYGDIDDKMPVFKYNDISKDDIWYFDIIRVCLRLLLTYPLNWII